MECEVEENIQSTGCLIRREYILLLDNLHYTRFQKRCSKYEELLLLESIEIIQKSIFNFTSALDVLIMYLMDCGEG